MNQEKRFFSTRRMVSVAMLLGITAILGFTPIGFIQIPPISITILHIPTIITAILLGPVEGIIVAIGMGATSFIRAIGAAGFDVLFIDPRLSFLPRILIPITTYYSYRLIKGLSKKIDRTKTASFFAAIIGSLTNTVGVLSLLYLLYGRQFIEIAGEEHLVKNIVIGAISFNVAVEMIAAAIVTTPIVYALKKLKY